MILYQFIIVLLFINIINVNACTIEKNIIVMRQLKEFVENFQIKAQHQFGNNHEDFSYAVNPINNASYVRALTTEIDPKNK